MAEEAKKVLCIEDNEEMIALIKLILERAGFRVIGAVGGREGLEAIAREKPDLVLLDIMMPDIDGWDVYRQMKASEEFKDIPVIVVTAKAQSIDEVLGLHIAKVDDYVTKPFLRNELLRSIDKVLGLNGYYLPEAIRLRELQASVSAATQELRELQDRGSEYNHAFYQVGMVTSSLMHDLRSHLALVKQSSSVLANQVEAKGFAHGLQTAESHHRYSTFLMDTLLELGLELDFRPVKTSARDLIVEAVAIIRHRLPPSIELVVKKPSKSLAVESDPTQARVALVSLLRYAVKAANTPGRIGVDVEKSNSNVDFTISSQPTSQYKDHATERLVKRIANRHGGTLRMRFLDEDEPQECRLKIILSLPKRLSLTDYVALAQNMNDVKRLRKMLDEARSKVWALRRTREQVDSAGPLATARRLTTEYTHELEGEITAMQASLAECLTEPCSERIIKHRLQRMNRHVYLARLLVATYRLLLQPQTASLESVKLKPIVEELVRLVVLEKTTAIEVEVGLQEGLAWQVDSFLFRVMLFNLLANAVQAMPEGGRLVMQAEVTEGQLLMTITDTGLGIQAENLPHLFDLGFTTRRHGFGIGMTVISRIVQTHNGRISVESAPGQGTALNIMFPLTDGTYA